jgi:DNA-binding GntR family transcriptional regulator
MGSDQTAAERVYTHVRAAILDGRFEGGARLREEQIASDVGVSRTPVREALRRLGAEGLVQLDSNRSGRVPVWTERDIEEIYGLRVLLEGHGARSAAANITDQQVAALKGILADTERLLTTSAEDQMSNEVTYAQLTLDFHQTVLAASADRHLLMLYGQLVNMPVLYRARHRYSRDRLEQSLREHRALVGALAAHDQDWAEALMRQHILAARAEEHRLAAAPPTTVD